MPRTLFENAVEVGLSRAHGGLAVFGSVRPNIWSVSNNDGSEIWKVGVADRSFSSSSSSSESIWFLGLEGGARKV
jgi:hypothetical protein